MLEDESWFVTKKNEMIEFNQAILDIDWSRLLTLSNAVVNTLRGGNRIAFVGNGGSAAEAMHLAAEFTSKCIVNHVPLNALCLNESQSAITAIGNDFGFDLIFSRLVEAHLTEGDILIALSTSGKSKNILYAIDVAKKLKIKTLLWTGNHNINIEGIDVWNCNLSSTPRIQEIHLIWGHLLAEMVELDFQNS